MEADPDTKPRDVNSCTTITDVSIGYSHRRRKDTPSRPFSLSLVAGLSKRLDIGSLHCYLKGR
jgi:hypothetical protein